MSAVWEYKLLYPSYLLRCIRVIYPATGPKVMRGEPILVATPPDQRK